MLNGAITYNKTVRKAFLFFLAGGTGFALYLCISNAMHYIFHVSEVPSAIAGTLLPVFPTFWMQRKLTFKSTSPKGEALLRYALLQVGNALLIGGLTSGGVRLGWPSALVFFVAGAVGVVVSYLVQAKLIFHGN